MFGQGTFPSDANKAKEVLEEENKREQLWGCTGNITYGEKDECVSGDFITNLISKLKEKTQSCKQQNNQKADTHCEDPPPRDETPPP